MLVITRYRVPDAQTATFRDLAEPALAALTARPGCLWAVVGRSVDEPTLWTLTSRWEGVGAYRRALSSYEVKLHTVPLMYQAVDEATAFEDVMTWSPGQGIAHAASGRAADADTANPGDAPSRN
jgi:quinol monooxygenase YgiN